MSPDSPLIWTKFFRSSSRGCSTKRIGTEHPSEGELVFKVDGQGGERITKVEVGMISVPIAVKVSTRASQFPNATS
jgi:hypothetical protein